MKEKKENEIPNNIPSTSGKKAHKIFKQYVMITLGALLQATGIYFFIMQNNISMSGVSGFSVVVSYAFRNVSWFPSKAVLVAVVNIFLLILGFLVLGRDFGIRTIYGTMAFTVFTYALEKLVPLTEPITGDILTELVIGIVMNSIGAALLFHNAATSGGADIIVMIIKKKHNVDIGQSVLVTNFIIAFSSFFIISIRIGVYSVMGLFMCAFLIDGVIERFDLCKYFQIVTEKPDEITEYILSKLHRGATKCNVIGGYSGNQKTLILTVCRKSEAAAFKRAVKGIDPDAFVMITNSSEIIGRGFVSGV